MLTLSYSLSEAFQHNLPVQAQCKKVSSANFTKYDHVLSVIALLFTLRFCLIVHI
jgi:hypothetical protein